MKLLYNLSYHLMGIGAIIAVYLIICYQWIAKKVCLRAQ